jgi:thymidine kinase
MHGMFAIVSGVRPQRFGVNLEQIDHRRAKEADVVLAEGEVASKPPVKQNLEFDACLAQRNRRGIEAAQVDEVEFLGKRKVFEHGLLAIQFVISFCVVGRP